MTTLRARMVDLSPLNPQQRQAVETLKGPLLILAGAGTGKTRVITYRMAHLVDRGISPGHILGVTFTNKAAREMKARVHQLIASKSRRPERDSRQDLTICTFHSLCVRILRRHIAVLGYKPNFVIYDESDQLGVVKKVLSHISARGDKLDPRDLLAKLSRYKNIGASALLKWGPGDTALVEHLLPRYDSALRACNAVDFDDLILLTLKLLQEHAEVLRSCRDKYRYVLVDEYQDTNAAQFQLVQLLTQQHRNLCVVGDDDQSIYGWRGAEIANLLDLEQHFPEVKIIKLEQNYRSTNTILQAANAVIQNNTRRRGKQLWSHKGNGPKIVLQCFANEDEEAQAIVENIECDRLLRRIPWPDQAVLFRTNAQSRPLEMALRHAGVRYRLIGGQSFFDRREIRDLLAYLKVFVNPHDENSLLRIANVPARGLSDATLERLLSSSHERRCSVFAAMRHSDVVNSFGPKTRESLAAFVQLIEDTRLSLQNSPPLALQHWAERWLAQTGYVAELRRSEKNPETAENRVRNLKELLAGLDDPAIAGAGPAERLLNFLEDITLDAERLEEKEEQENGVTLITMHSCKGLEFPHVQIAGLEQGLLPHSRSAEEGNLDEERRLFYVAITRAMKTLRISYCGSRKKFGQLTPCYPSPFLSELPTDLLEYADSQARQPVKGDTGKDLFAAMRKALEKPDGPGGIK